MDRESLRLLLAQGMSVEKIGERFGKHPSTVAYWMAKHGLGAPNRDKRAAKGGIEREVLTALVDDGLTIAGIGEALGCSRTAVRYWLGQYGLRTQRSRGADMSEQARIAREGGTEHDHPGLPSPREHNVRDRRLRSVSLPPVSGRSCQPTAPAGEADSRG